jgi:predicted nuclease of predicted toxin-antitoxin system
MRILLDERIDRRLAAAIAGHEKVTLPEMGWANFKNGEWLTIAQEEFDVFLTVDRNLPHQQNLPKYNIAVVVLQAKSNR